MRPYQKVAAIGLVVLLGAAVYGLIRTSQRSSGQVSNAHVAGVASGSAVDQTPILTALKLAQMRTTEEEKPFAQQALDIADKEMDQVYAAAKRDLEEHPAPLTAEAKQIESRL